jgi:hypothetical protein
MRMTLPIALALNSLVFGMYAGELAANAATTNRGAAWHGPRVIVNPDMQDVVDSWFKGAATNGLVCAVEWYRPIGGKDPLPMFIVDIINSTTNIILNGLNFPSEALLKIELFDARGEPVPKKAAGQQFGKWTEKELDDWNDETRRTRSLGRFLPLIGLEAIQVSGGLSVPKLFQIRKPGEYTLHLRMRFIQSKVGTAGKVYLQTTWLPEVVSPVEIFPQDLASMIPAPVARKSASNAPGPAPQPSGVP